MVALIPVSLVAIALLEAVELWLIALVSRDKPDGHGDRGITVQSDHKGPVPVEKSDLLDTESDEPGPDIQRRKKRLHSMQEQLRKSPGRKAAEREAQLKQMRENNRKGYMVGVVFGAVILVGLWYAALTTGNSRQHYLQVTDGILDDAAGIVHVPTGPVVSAENNEKTTGECSALQKALQIGAESGGNGRNDDRPGEALDRVISAVCRSLQHYVNGPARIRTGDRAIMSRLL